MPILGTRKQIGGWTCQGVLPSSEMMKTALEVIKLVGMTPARLGRIDEYPYNGLGGVGYTLYQPLTDSYIIFDVYSEINETKVILASCKPYNHQGVGILLRRLIGPLIQQGSFNL